MKNTPNTTTQPNLKILSFDLTSVFGSSSIFALKYEVSELWS
jgi:hypothetical protein